MRAYKTLGIYLNENLSFDLHAMMHVILGIMLNRAKNVLPPKA
jgi:hypothetical protein